MNPVGKALWYIESHFAGEIALDDIAAVAGVSRYHLARAFAVATDRSVMRYVRGRRLSEAAKVLADGAGDILTVALDWGYGSHEAFTRAFRDQFGLTPEAVRAQHALDNLALVEPIRMDETLLATLQPPRFENGRQLLIVGLSGRYNAETTAGIPAQWQRFVPHIGHIPNQIGGRVAYGVCCNCDDAGNMDYLSGVEVSDFSDVPAEFARIRIPPRRYAVFVHSDHISQIRRTWHTIWNVFMPTSGHEVADAPDFERYGETFDPRTGTGGLEIWIPLKA
jgi:AraC family transcriptional regulator